MLAAVLVLALFGLWSLVVLALLVAYEALEWSKGRQGGGAAPLVRRPRLSCTVCGSHYFTEVEADQLRRQRDA